MGEGAGREEKRTGTGAGQGITLLFVCFRPHPPVVITTFQHTHAKVKQVRAAFIIEPWQFDTHRYGKTADFSILKF